MMTNRFISNISPKSSKYKTNLIILIFMALSISCNKKNEIESLFITNKNEYWQYRDYCWNTKGIYFRYNKDGTSNQYFLHIDDGFSLFDKNGTLRNGPALWSVKNDSTFVFDYSEYKIEKINKEEILLSYYHYKIKDKKCFVKLSKWVDGPDGPKLLNTTDKLEK
jgi:hypothetical protein